MSVFTMYEINYSLAIHADKFIFRHRPTGLMEKLMVIIAGVINNLFHHNVDLVIVSSKE